jgi:hypothetical protein
MYATLAIFGNTAPTYMELTFAASTVNQSDFGPFEMRVLRYRVLPGLVDTR